MLYTRKAQTNLISFSVGLRMPMKDNARGRVYTGKQWRPLKKQIVDALDLVFFTCSQ